MIRTTMKEFYGPCGDLLASEQAGEKPPQVKFSYEGGEAVYNGETWLFLLYDQDERRQVQQAQRGQ